MTRSRGRSAIAIADGRILAVGTDAEVRAHETAATRVIDLGGRTVVPGLADNHFHSAGGGAGVDLSGARTLAEVLSAIAAAVREAAPGAVVVTNSDWHEAQLAEQRLPLRRDLDAVAPDHPVVVVRGGQEYVLNSAGLARWGITADTPVPAGGEISRYDDGSLRRRVVERRADRRRQEPGVAGSAAPAGRRDAHRRPARRARAPPRGRLDQHPAPRGCAGPVRAVWPS